MGSNITILGAGSWGMAMARHLHRIGNTVMLWEFDVNEYRRLIDNRSIPEKLRDFALPEGILLTNDLDEAVDFGHLMVLAVPAQHVRAVVSRIGDHLSQIEGGLVNLAKGIEASSLRRVSEILHEESSAPLRKIVTMSGPSHAEEVIRDMPTTVVAAGPDDPFVEYVQQVFSTNSFRVYKSDDLVGVELGGSLKNIIAIAAGILDGLGLGDNTKGALITRGLAEITRLGVAMGAQAETFAGLSGIGDLVTTCFSRHSRNRYVGEHIARGEKLPAILNQLKMVAEGVETTRSGRELARIHNVEMPITEQIYQVLFEDKTPSTAIEDLMGRDLKPEIW
ncbi:MAG: NAD(P)H-dependent glycerol-3-phosphate dehydrogenase [Candidatus Zixiibacteriota bacterium]